MTSPTPRLTLQLLGLFRLASRGVGVDLAYEKGRALLAFLALQAGRSYTRDYLAQLLWPALERTTALANLRLVLHNLRPLINGEDDAQDNALLQVSRSAVALQVDERIDVDAIRFLAPTLACTTVAAPGFCTDCLADMAQCAALYQGEFLQGFALPDCPEFEDWLYPQRERVLQRALSRLAQLSDTHERAGAFTQALPFAQRFLALDPWNEHGSRRVMRLLALCAQHDAALSHFDRWCRVVKDELGLLPSEETRTLAEHIRNHALPPKGRRSSDASLAAPTVPLSRAQRRQVTVLHCALEVGGVDDPDAAMARLHGPQQRCGDIIRAFSGYLVQAHGGSLLAYFGYPHAVENSARQAVRAALALRDEKFIGLSLRMGVHTGMVISGGEPDVPDAIGAASNVAIRLRQQLDDGEIAISRATHRLVAGYFDCTAHTGDACRVLQESGARDRLEAADTLTPLVGRTQELATLLALWQQAQQGSPRAVLLQGDAGIGKSRLVLSLKQALKDTPFASTEMRCVPEYSQTPFHPLIELFQATMGFVATDSTLSRAQKLAQYVATHYPGEQADVHALLAKLLSLPMPSPANDALTTSPRQRERTLQIVLERLYTMAQPRPVLLVVEDLHWADPSSLELLNRVISHQRPGAWMAVMTARPDFSPPWAQDRCATMPLQALNTQEARALVDAVLPELPPAVARSIVQRADGIPLFLEELAKELTGQDLSAIPSTLQDLLTARLDAGAGSHSIFYAASPAWTKKPWAMRCASCVRQVCCTLWPPRHFNSAMHCCAMRPTSPKPALSARPHTCALQRHCSQMQTCAPNCWHSTGRREASCVKPHAAGLRPASWPASNPPTKRSYCIAGKAWTCWHNCPTMCSASAWSAICKSNWALPCAQRRATPVHKAQQPTPVPWPCVPMPSKNPMWTCSLPCGGCGPAPANGLTTTIPKNWRSSCSAWRKTSATRFTFNKPVLHKV
jgi:DNA-binding SARP family transcriptional activator